MSLRTQIVASTFAIVAGIQLTTSAIGVEAQSPEPSDTASVTFLCKIIDKVPSTVARRVNIIPSTTRRNNEKIQDISVIEWSRSSYSDSKETPLERCTRVSKLLQHYSVRGTLNYISSGDMDGNKVICATNGEGSSCSVLIFTLEKDDEPKQLVDDLRQVIKDPSILTSTRTISSIKTNNQSIIRNDNQWIRNGRGSSGDSGTIQRSDDNTTIQMNINVNASRRYSR